MAEAGEAQAHKEREAVVPILIVEDDGPLRHLMRETLEDEGLPTVTAADGVQALRLVAQRRPALVVLDLMLPGVDGVGVAAGVRARYGASAPPILLITAAGHGAVTAEQVGAVAYLAKPFDLDHLIATVRRALDAR